jgi:molybdopterin/thiamine biosynthesis adenylyltransferase
LRDVDTLDPAAWDAFRAELVRAGFDPVPGTGVTQWEGPIAPAFAPFTDAQLMRLRLNAGWPFIPPSLFVQGFASEHVAASGEVCLWRGDDPSREWLTLDGIYNRIEGWCHKAREGFDPTDRALDAHRYFEVFLPELAVFDPDEFRPASGFVDAQMGTFSASSVKSRAVELRPGLVPGFPLRGHWYYRDRVALPPRTLEEFTALLGRGQHRNFERGLDRLRRQVDGAIHLAALMWPRYGELDFLILRFKVVGAKVTAAALQAAPNDRRTLLRRAGPDAPALQRSVVAVIGCGAVGSHLALMLGESGVGSIRLLDEALLRPGHVVRHVAGHGQVGEEKAAAVHAAIQTHAPWANTRITTQRPAAPSEIATILQDADLTVDAAGSAPVTEIVSRVAEREHRPLLSVALYRGGAIGRVRRQWPERDTPIHRRAERGPYPIIPPGEDDTDGLEVGCAAPVNNAMPASVAAVAALGVQLAVDALCGRWEYPEEVTDVYRAISVAPFDRVGRVPLGR